MKSVCKIIILGSTGQLGTALKQVYQNNDRYISTFLNRRSVNLSRTESIHKLKDYDFDILINTAAYTAVDKAESQQRRCAKINALALEEIAAICQKKQALCVHFSTDYVYDNDLNRPLLETDPTTPKSTYGITKLLGEKLLRAICKKHFIIRTSWLYSRQGQNFVNTMIRLSKEKDEIRVVNDQIGSPTFVDDLALVTDKLISLYREGNQQSDLFGTYNFSNQGETTWYGFAKEVFRIKNIKTPLLPITTEDYPTPAKRPAYSVMDCTKIKAVTGMTIPDWQDGLRRCLED